MKLFQTTYNNSFVQTVANWKLKGKNALFHVFVPFDLNDNKGETDKGHYHTKSGSESQEVTPEPIVRQKSK